MGKIIRRDESDEAKFYLRFKGIERYHEYDTIADFVRDWRDYDEYVKEEITPLEQTKSESRRRIDLFLRRTKKIPTDKSGYNNWKQRGDSDESE
jgi:hypothetical protein